MLIAERIKAILEQKAAIIGQMDTLSEKTLDEGEQKTFDDLGKELLPLDASLKNLELVERLHAANSASPVAPVVVPTTPAVVTPMANADKTLFVAKQAHALYKAGGNRISAGIYAKNTLKDDLLAKTFEIPADVIQRATVLPGDATTAGWAAELVEINQANAAFIDMLRPMSIVARFPGRPMSFDGAGSIKIPRQTLGSNGGWVAEGGGIPVGRLTLDSITLTPKKSGTIVAISNELLERSTPSAMALIRDDILAGIAGTIDTQFVSADTTAGRPAGIQTYDGTSVVSGGDTLALILADLKAAITAMLAVNMPMVKPVWLLNPAIVNSLRFMIDGMGNFVFKDELNSGTLVGYPYLESTTVTSTVVMLVM